MLFGWEVGEGSTEMTCVARHRSGAVVVSTPDDIDFAVQRYVRLNRSVRRLRKITRGRIGRTLLGELIRGSYDKVMYAS